LVLACLHPIKDKSNRYSDRFEQELTGHTQAHARNAPDLPCHSLFHPRVNPGAVHERWSDSDMKIKDNKLDLMKGFPRGLSDKYLQDQSIPQARWQSQEVIETHPALEYDPANPQGKILIGAIGEKLIGIKDDRHIQTVAGNRSGKSVTVTANLMFYDGSVIVIDPKGEHANLTAERRAGIGQDVYVLDPFNRTKGSARKYTAKYNALKKLKIDSDTVIEDAMQIIDAQIVKSGEEKDPHWNETAGASLLGFVLYAAFGSDVPEDERNLITVRRFVTQARRQERIDEDTTGYALPRRIVAGIKHLKNGRHDDIADAIEASVRGFYEKSHDEMAGVLSTMNRHTSYLDFRSMKHTASGHDFDLEDLKRKPNGVTIYLCLPATKLGSCRRWLRTFIIQLIDAMENEETAPKVPVLAILDEFPVLGHLKALEDAAGQIASFDLILWTILQDWGQGKAIYGERWESFAANCGLSQFFANVDLTTTEYISRRLGKTPVLSLRQGDTSSEQREKGLSGRSQSKQLYDLLTPDEVARTFARSDPLKRQLILLAGLNPMAIQRVEYWNATAPYARFFRNKFIP
jgi:type IV secretion system protein VirD4